MLDSEQRKQVRLVVSADSDALSIVSAELFDAGAAGLVEEDGRLIAYPQSEAERAAFGERLATLGARFSSLSVEVQEVDDDWQQIWQRELGPEPISPSFVLVPTHCQAQEDTARQVLWFRPRASFGAGEHPTTRLAATWLETWLLEHPHVSCFDVGTGTGVLAMVAAKMGARPVLAVDSDPIAIESATDNVALNRLETIVEVQVGSAHSAGRGFDVVVANINTPILQKLAPDLAQAVAPGGVMALTGLLTEDTQEIESTFASLGRSLVQRRDSGDWALLILR